MTETHVALVSGGQDSTAAAHYAHENEGMEVLVYLDTRTGIPSNREYVENLADHLGLQLWTLRTQVSYADRVKENGFPGQSRHGIMYRSLKERQLGKLATITNGRGNAPDLHFWTGIRRAESKNREDIDKVQEKERWTTHSPLADWTIDQVQDYIDEHSLPKNPLWPILGRSGDCYCGCYASPAELTDLRAAGEEEHALRIEKLQEEVREERAPSKKNTWGWGGLKEHQQAAEKAKQDPAQLQLCSGCEKGVSP